MFFHKKENKSIKQISLMAILFAGLFAFISACLIVVNEYFEFQKEIAKVEAHYVETQKESMQAQMNLLLNIVSYRYHQSKLLSPDELYLLLKEDVRYLMSDLKQGHTIFLQKRSGEILFHSNLHGQTNVENELRLMSEYPPLDLVLGSSVSMESMADVLKAKKSDYEDKIIGFILKIYMLTLFLYLVSTIEYRYVSDIMGREIRYIVESFKKASQSYEPIDMQKINFKELKEITSHANGMLQKIKDKNGALLELNTRLEHLVEEKTQELRRSVDFTQELLERQDRFVKNAIHEINTPLSIILMNIDLYNLKFEKNPYLVKIEAAVKVLDNIYEDLAYVVKKDRVVYEKSMVDFSHFLKDRVEYFEDVAEGNKLSIQCYIAPDLFVVFSEVELQRVCDNNISNAIKYSYEGKVLHVKLYEEGERVIFEIENCGEKILQPDKLFDRYYREDVARGGFGLGLNIVKEICDANDVGIEILSDEEKTVFRYHFVKA